MSEITLADYAKLNGVSIQVLRLRRTKDKDFPLPLGKPSYAFVFDKKALDKHFDKHPIQVHKKKGAEPQPSLEERIARLEERVLLMENRVRPDGIYI